MDDAGLHDRLWPHVADHLGQSLETITDHEERVLDPAVAQIGEHAHPKLRSFTAGTGPQSEDVAFPGQGDPDRGVERPVGDLAVADLHHDRVDEDRGVGLIQRPHRPIVHLLEYLVGDSADGLLGHRRTVDLGEVRRNLPSGKPFGIQRQHDLINPRQPALTLLDDLRLEGRCPIPGHVDLDRAGGVGQHRLGSGAIANVASPRLGRVVFLVAEVLGHLLVKSRFEHCLGQLFDQPVGSGQRQALFLGQSDQLDRSLLLCGLLGRLLLRHIFQCRHHGTFLAEHRSACQCRKHRYFHSPDAPGTAELFTCQVNRIWVKVLAG
ncbi:Uncharacterised protein [Mycobacteroides abscessus subsp. abscessus]|nr:Uncharacterised protein [Mycobacteroides abscessus subsp. abscessus]